VPRSLATQSAVGPVRPDDQTTERTSGAGAISASALRRAFYWRVLKTGSTARRRHHSLLSGLQRDMSQTAQLRYTHIYAGITFAAGMLPADAPNRSLAGPLATVSLPLMPFAARRLHSEAVRVSNEKAKCTCPGCQKPKSNNQRRSRNLTKELNPAARSQRREGGSN